MTGWKRWAVGGLAVLLGGCSSEPQDTCTTALEGDGVYDGYDYCSDARYPNFLSEDGRWDGTYAEDCSDAEGEHAFACSEQLFWHTLQFDHDGRDFAYQAMSIAFDRNESKLSDTHRARMSWRIGQLGVAMVAEQGNLSAIGEVESRIRYAHELEPDHIIIEAWLYTVLINTAVALGQDPEEHLDGLWALYERDPAAVSGTVMGVAAGMPIDSGWPDIAVDLVDGVDMEDCGQWCDWSFHRASFGLAGQYFSYAEVMARVGNRERTLEFLELTRAADHYEQWPVKADADAAYDDVDAFIGKFAERADDESVTDLLLSGSDAACIMCHAPL